jgi:hypothetical protein
MSAAPDAGVDVERISLGIELKLGMIDGLPSRSFVVGTDGGDLFVGEESLDVGNGECFQHCRGFVV